MAGFERNRYLLWERPISTWAWCLSEGEDGTARLVTRIRIFYDWRRPASALFSLLLNEFGDYPMMRRMLLGIKERAEGMAPVPTPPANRHTSSRTEEHGNGVAGLSGDSMADMFATGTSPSESAPSAH